MMYVTDQEHQTYSKALSDSFLSPTEEKDLPVKFLPQSKERHTRQARTDGKLYITAYIISASIYKNNAYE